MFDGNDDTNPPRTTQETYACAVSSGSTKTVPHRTSPGDMVAAAGMSQFRMGTALMRLLSEWQGGATPKQGAAPKAKDLRKRGHEADFAEAEARRLAAALPKWHLHEQKMRFQRLKTLPAVRAALRFWVLERWGDMAAAGADQVVADTLRHFLAPVCPVCEGRKRKVIQSRAIGAECKPCRGTGEADLQHGGRGRALLGYMKQCLGQAASDMREGAHRLRRTDTSEKERQEHRSNETATKLRRADAEAKADDAADREGIAEKFRASMVRVR